LSTDYESILERVQSRNAILFLGSGSTVQCETNDGKPGLTGAGLAKEIIQELVGSGKPLPIPPDKMPGLMEAAEYYQYNHPGRRNALDKFIQSRLRGLRPTIGHYLATSFPWKAVVTTNYNTVAEDAWSEAVNHGFNADEILTIRTNQDILTYAGETTKIRLYKPHGCVNLQMTPNQRMVLTSRDYSLSQKLRSDIYAAIFSLAGTSTTVFIGYSLADYTFRNMYYRLLLELGEWSHQSYSIAPIDPPILYTWKSKAMAELNTTLVNTTFDVFMLGLVKARGSLHAELKKLVIDGWTKITAKNPHYGVEGLSLADFEKM